MLSLAVTSRRPGTKPVESRAPGKGDLAPALGGEGGSCCACRQRGSRPPASSRLSNPESPCHFLPHILSFIRFHPKEHLPGILPGEVAKGVGGTQPALTGWTKGLAP